MRSFFILVLNQNIFLSDGDLLTVVLKTPQISPSHHQMVNSEEENAEGNVDDDDASDVYL